MCHGIVNGLMCQKCVTKMCQTLPPLPEIRQSVWGHCKRPMIVMAIFNMARHLSCSDTPAIQARSDLENRAYRFGVFAVMSHRENISFSKRKFLT